MKAFEISERQIAAIVGALVADELGWRFRRHIDFLTVASISRETPLCDGGLKLDAAEYDACARRAAAFFDSPLESLSDGARTIDDWSSAIASSLKSRLVRFRFTAAGRDSANQSSEHRADAVFADAAAVSNLIYGRRRVVSLVAPHGMLGFVLTVLTPNLQQIESVDARGATFDEVRAMLAFGDAIVATPTQWRFMMRQGLKAPDNAMAVYFGEAMPPDLAAEMRHAGFGAQREVYGSTETGLIGWRDSPSEAFRLFDTLACDGEDLLRTVPDGATLRLRPMDILEWEGDRAFRLAGRRDGAVQIGGVNVFPDRIATVIAAHAGVDACEVTLSRHKGGFERLIASIRLAGGAQPSERIARDIDQYCRGNLHPNERPRVYRYLGSASDAS